jgi:hypothetical protein
MTRKACHGHKRIHPNRGDISIRRSGTPPGAAVKLLFSLSILTLLGTGCSPEDVPSLTDEALPVVVELAAEGFTRPLFVTAPPGDSSRIFVVEQGGAVHIVSAGLTLPDPFLDIGALVSTGSERGLLGLAFHPGYASNGRFFVSYTDLNGDTAVVRYERSSSDANRAYPASASAVLQVSQPYGNHNGGMLAFGPDGCLYIGMGDGGGANDPDDNARNLGTLLGKISRVDVDGAAPYEIPPDNPFAGAANVKGEIWSYGLRNPWRFSFDRTNGDLYIGDVGQNAREEIDVQASTSGGGENYGWDPAEGFACPGGGGTCGKNPGFTPPVLDYGRGDGRSVTGGYVYRGTAVPELAGTYFFGDFVTAKVWSFRLEAGAPTELVERVVEIDSGGGRSIGNISSFGEDGAGELYIVDYEDGEIYRIVDSR